MPASIRLVVRCVALLTVAVGLAHAQEPAAAYPRKAVRIVVPAAAGGGADIIARLIGQQLGRNLGQTFIVENRPGAANIIGTEVVAKAPPDGYTLLLGTTGPLAMNPLLYAKLPYDAVKDFSTISNVADSPFVLVVHPSLPVHSVAELVKLARAKPGQLSYASWGRGSSTHLATELFMTMTQVQFVQVPYKGSGNAIPDMLAGNVQLAFDSMLSSVPHVRVGRLRPLGISALKRSGVLPDVPTLAESGLAGFEAGSWYGFLAPAKTSPDIVSKLHDEIMKALKVGEVQERLASLGTEPIGNTPAEFAAQIRNDLAKWGKVVHAAGIQPE
ncbi:MAG TPA: tripartite tricarboxylate transporter substrate binding protein [Burkholderiales bacterium]|nr:tripartite tricarboxylate transporter substrate binding protein [Burkholderiales bacterium]